MKVNLSRFQNDWYKPGNKIKIILWYFINAIFYKSSFPWPQLLKSTILKYFGAVIGNNVLFKSNVNIKYPWFLEVGNNVWIGENVWIDNLAKVTILDNVCISQGAMLLCGNHNYKKTTFDLMVNEIILEEGVWIGAKSVVCPGVTCKTHAVLSVGSIANKDLDSYSINQGNPAIKIKERTLRYYCSPY